MKNIDRTAGVGGLGKAAAWLSAVCCLPYLFLKVVWTLDIPVGITDRSVLHSKGWVAGNALMAVIELVGLMLVLALTRSWVRRLPCWLLLFPTWVGTGLLFQVAIGAVLFGLSATSSHGSSADTAGFQPWVFVVVYPTFAGQGVALAIAFAYYVRARWGRMLGQPTGRVTAVWAGQARSWPERHMTQIATAVALMTVAVAVLCGYWAAGGSYGPSGAQPHPSAAMQLSRMAGAAVAAAGLLGLAGRWGRRRRLWLAAALTWIGSGALAAFDGLELLLFAVFRPDTSEGGWSLADTVTATKVVIGVLAAATGVLALASAARDGDVDSSDEEPDHAAWPPDARPATDPVTHPYAQDAS